jgi:acyl carrier protein
MGDYNSRNLDWYKQMEINEFIDILKEALEIESFNLTTESDLSSLSEFDSLAIMSIIALTDEHFGKKLSAQQLSTITTVQSLLELIGLENFQ